MLEVYHSRPIAPTRRVALGHCELPVSPAPGFGGILLGGVVARHVGDMDPDLVDDLVRLTLQLQEGHRIPQPRLRYRFQTDRIGLQRSTHRLVNDGDALRFEFDVKGAPEQQILGAVYAAGGLDPVARRVVMDAIRAGVRWNGGSDAALIAHLAGYDRARALVGVAAHDPIYWALTVLGLGNREDSDDRQPDRDRIQHQFRALLREAHPDHGGDADDAAQRIADLSEARRILLTA